MSQNSLNFLDYFKDIKDPRIERKKLYPINEILLITISGLICGAEGWKDLELFAKQKIDFLKFATQKYFKAFSDVILYNKL